MWVTMTGDKFIHDVRDLLPNPDEAVVVVAAEPKPNAVDAVVLAPNEPKENPEVSSKEKQTQEELEVIYEITLTGLTKLLGSHENSLAKTANGSHTNGRNSYIMRDNRRWSCYLIKRTLELYMSYLIITRKEFTKYSNFAKNLISPAGWSHHDDG